MKKDILIKQAISEELLTRATGLAKLRENINLSRSVDLARAMERLVDPIKLGRLSKLKEIATNNFRRFGDQHERLSKALGKTKNTFLKSKLKLNK